MYFPNQNSNYFTVFYMGTDPNIPKPGSCTIKLLKKGIKIQKRGLIEAGQLVSTKVAWAVVGQSLSAGGALLGGMIAGDIGAIAGASRGNKKVEAHTIVTYTDSAGQEQQLDFITKKAEKLKKKIDKYYSLK